MKDYPWGKGTVNWLRDATANDSDKSFTVPAGKIWDVKKIHIQLVTTATVGNRMLAVNIAADGTNYLYMFGATAQAASLTRYYLLGCVTVSDDFTTATFTTAQDIGPTILPAGAVIRVYDSAAIDVAADDLIVVLHYVEYDA